MRKGTDIIGKDVVAVDTGEKVQTISDLVFDQNTNQLLGFLVDEGGWFSEAKVLPLQNVQSIGPDAVLIASRAGVVEAPRVPAMHQILQRNNILKGTRVLTTDGRDLGTLADLYFDEYSGQVEGYDVSGGIFADAYTGRSFIPATHTLNIGKDAAFVPPEVAALMEVQEDGGIKGALQNAGDKVKSAAQT
ncbi:MAG TPA: PRC-barrel domain-containing protein, partial [Herpetosiphonaceae bacterium]|nr:PRC-barrel domain-containing protein [Herpetosiphonaceae bacterium]